MPLDLASIYNFPLDGDHRRRRHARGHMGGGAKLEGWYVSTGPFWQNTARTIPAVLDGDLVRVWDDVSGNGRHLFASSDARRPTLKLAVQGGKNALLFVASSLTYLAGSTAVDWKFLSNGGGFLAAVVFKTTSSNPGVKQTLLGNNEQSTSNIGIQIGVDDTQSAVVNDALIVLQTKGVGGQATLNYYGNAATGPLQNGVGVCSSGRWHAVAATYVPNTVGNDLQVVVDGDIVGAADTTNAPQAVGAPSAPIHVGIRGPSLGGAYLDGYIGEIMLLSGSVTFAQGVRNSQLAVTSFGITDVATLAASNRVPVAYRELVGSNNTLFPTWCICPDGTYIAIFGRANSHNGADQRLVQRRSSDGGLTWGNLASEVVFFDTVGQPDTNAVVSTIGTRMWAAFTPAVFPSGLVRRTYVCFSDDNGGAWSAPVDVGAQGYTEFVATGGPIFVAQDNGDLLLACYARNSAATNYDCILLQSGDDGATWTKRSTIATASNVQYEEPQVNYLDNGTLMALVRVDGNHTIQAVYSTDHGVTWGTPQYAFSGFGWPIWKQFANGAIVALTRHFDPLYDETTRDPACFSVYRVSRDRGVTWQAERKLGDSDHVWFYAYGGIQEISPNVAGILHAQADPNNSSEARMEFVRLAVT